MDFVHPIEAIIPGVQGKVLAVLAETTADLNMRTIARLADVSAAQASRVLPDLVELGLVERREAPPSSLFRLSGEHVAARTLTELARSRETVLEDMSRLAGELLIEPVSVIVFGSFARGEADANSDLDVLFIRPEDVSEDDEEWAAVVEHWRAAIIRASGNDVEVLEVGASEVPARVRGNRPVWRDIQRDGIAVHGSQLQDLVDA
jgi:DNA-binding transcriptional ArsR family regulator